MDESRQRPLIIRILSSRVLWALVAVVLILFVMGWSQNRLSAQVQATQGQFVADSVRRCAVECYSIEGRFPDTTQGVKYLEDNYGLAIDHKRYVVYYESMGDNLIPQIRVIPIPQTSAVQEIAKALGLQGPEG